MTAYLTTKEIEQVQRLLSDPFSFPPEFTSWLTSYIEAFPPTLPISQIIGFLGFTAKYATVATSETTTSTTYANLATTGPSLQLADGTWIIASGVTAFNSTAANSDYASISVNGSTAVDADAILVTGIGTPGLSAVQCVTKTLAAGGANTVTMKFRTSANTATFLNRWLLALKVSN